MKGKVTFQARVQTRKVRLVKGQAFHYNENEEERI